MAKFKIPEQVVLRESLPRNAFGGPAPLKPGEVARRVTSGDIARMFAQVTNMDGNKKAAA